MEFNSSQGDLMELSPLFSDDSRVAEAASIAQKLRSFAEEDIGRQGVTMQSVAGNATASRGLEVAVGNLQEYCNEINEEPQNVNVPQEAGQNGNSVATGISDVEQMLQEKTFTRSEIQRLTALLHSRTTESPSDDVVERDSSKPSSSPFSHLRHEASTSGSLKKYRDERDNLYAAISTPIVSPRVREEDIASPADIAKAFMGTRSSKVAPLFDSTTSHPKTPTSVATKTANSFRNVENSFVTPRSRGRSAMYNVVRTPFPISPSVYIQKISLQFEKLIHALRNFPDDAMNPDKLLPWPIQLSRTHMCKYKVSKRLEELKHEYEKKNVKLIEYKAKQKHRHQGLG